MSEFSDLVSQALAEAIEFMGETIIVGSKSLSAVVNLVAFDETLQDGGLLTNRGITAVVASMPVLPAIGSPIIYQGRRYRLLEIKEDSAGVEFVCATDAT